MLIEDSHISFINLAHRKDRLTAMEATLKKAGIPAIRTEALRPIGVIGIIEPMSRLDVMFNRTPGAIGCHFSQVAVMEEALKQKKHAWVMEDDLDICDDIQERLDYIEQFCSTHPWDIIWMGGTFHVNPPHWWDKQLGRDAQCTDDPRMMRTFGCFCTYSYIVNQNSIEKVLHGLDHWLDRSMGIDWAMIMLQPTLLTYAFVPGCCKQYDNQSDIGNGITRFSNFKELGPYWYARRMEDFDPTTFNWKEATENRGSDIYPMALEGIREPRYTVGPAARRRRDVFISRQQKRERQR